MGKAKVRPSRTLGVSISVLRSIVCAVQFPPAKYDNFKATNIRVFSYLLWRSNSKLFSSPCYVRIRMKKDHQNLITSWDKKFAEFILAAQYVGLDTETVSLTDKTMVGFSIAVYDKSYYIPVRDHVLENMPIERAQVLLEIILTNCTIILHNSGFDLPVIDKFGLDISLIHGVHDTLLMANLVDENIRHGLKGLVKRYFHYTMTELKELCGTGQKRISFADAPKEKYLYACDDAYYTLKLFHYLTDRLIDDRKPAWVYAKIERPLLHVVADMHSKGITIDVQKVKEIKDKCEGIISLSETKLRIEMGDEINFGSTQQLKKYFIDERHMPIIKTSPKTGNPSMDKEVLEKYSETNAVAKTLLEYRKYSKIMSTFIPALTPSEWDLKTMTGKIHASFNQAGTTSGRFSSSRPNMQNIPRTNDDDHDDMRIREAIVPDPGEILIGADYSQIELRVLAHFSQDPNLVKAYNEGKDIHQQTADACGCSRYDAKTVNFGLVYGMGSKTLAKKIKVSVDQAQQYIDRYFDTYAGVKKFWAESEKNFVDFGFVETLSGRKRRRSDNFEAKDTYDQGGEVRSATNAIIQGSAADLLKMAMVSMHSRLKEFNARIISTVHDEVLVSCPIKYAKCCYDIVKSSMMKAGKDLSVPVDVSIKFGRSWEEAHGDGIKLEDFKNDFKK